MDDTSIANFQSYLREEAWDSVYNSIDVNNIFNKFHCILLRHFESSFPSLYKHTNLIIMVGLLKG